jgi:hypothetical protein
MRRFGCCGTPHLCGSGASKSRNANCWAGPALALLRVFELPYFATENHMWRLFKEFLLFARQEKKWWLIPLVVVLLVLGAILIFASSSGIAWALYPFF